MRVTSAWMRGLIVGAILGVFFFVGRQQGSDFAWGAFSSGLSLLTAIAAAAWMSHDPDVATLTLRGFARRRFQALICQCGDPKCVVRNADGVFRQAVQLYEWARKNAAQGCEFYCRIDGKLVRVPLFEEPKEPVFTGEEISEEDTDAQQ